jgi:hypothetical protein
MNTNGKFCPTWLLIYHFHRSLESELFKRVAEDLGRTRARSTIVPNTNLSRVIHPNDLSQLTVDLCGVLTLRLRGKMSGGPVFRSTV